MAKPNKPPSDAPVVEMSEELKAAIEDAAQQVVAGGVTAEGAAGEITNMIPSADAAKIAPLIAQRAKEIADSAANNDPVADSSGSAPLPGTEGKVLVDVPRGFILRLTHQLVHEIAPGAQWMQRELAEHHYSQAVGVKIFDPKAEELKGALAALPTQIKMGQYKDGEYVVKSMKAYFGDLFPEQKEAEVRALFPKE